jgi:hypothetical protein
MQQLADRRRRSDRILFAAVQSLLLALSGHSLLRI